MSTIKELLTNFVSEVKEDARYVKNEIIRQYRLSILKEIGDAYPETESLTKKIIELIDAPEAEVPDFVEPSEDSLDFPDEYEPQYPYDSETPE